MKKPFPINGLDNHIVYYRKNSSRYIVKLIKRSLNKRFRKLLKNENYGE